MNEEKNKKVYKLKSKTEQIDDVLNFCNYYGVVVNTDNISIIDDVLILNGIDKTSFNILSDNLNSFFRNVFYNRLCYVEQFDINIKNVLDKDNYSYKETYECKFKYDHPFKHIL